MLFEPGLGGECPGQERMIGIKQMISGAPTQDRTAHMAGNLGSKLSSPCAPAWDRAKDSFTRDPTGICPLIRDCNTKMPLPQDLPWQSVRIPKSNAQLRAGSPISQPPN